MSEIQPSKNLTTWNFDHHLNVMLLKIKQLLTSSSHFWGVYIVMRSIPQYIALWETYKKKLWNITIFHEFIQL